MNGSPSSVISAGFGTWGSTGLTLTLGFGISGVSATITGQWSNVIHAHSGGIIHAKSGGRIEAESGGRIEVRA